MTTYKQFTIADNLRCYDPDGRPVFPYTEFKTEEEAKLRIDKYWEEWQKFEANRNINVNKLWDAMKERLDEEEDGRVQDAEDFAARVDDYYERELLGDN